MTKPLRSLIPRRERNKFRRVCHSNLAELFFINALQKMFHLRYIRDIIPVVLSREAVLEQVERLARSEVLHNSESLCKLLRYLAEQSLEHPGATIKEYQIATEVFHRSEDFDPQLDSVIRVQAGRLRTKLASYYAGDGTEDRIVVELPKGNYTLHFHENPRRAKAEAAGEGNGNGHNHERTPQGANVDAGLRLARYAVPVLSVLLALALATLGMLLWRGSAPTAQPAAAADKVPPSIQLFWGSFLAPANEPWVVFSNATFVGRPETGLRYSSASTPTDAASGKVFDHYTGVGEVLAVHELDEVFSRLHATLRVKRGSLFSLDDLKQNNLIFLGSPAENLTLRDIPSTSHFVFQRVAVGPRKGDLAIATINPQQGEPLQSLASPADQALAEDYAVIGYKRGMESSRLVLIIAGTTTFGTQGAVEFLCHKETLEELLGKLNAKKVEELKPFEALLRVKISRGVPVETTLIALHPDQ